MVRSYARRTPGVDRMILACFVLGLSTRKATLQCKKARSSLISRSVCSTRHSWKEQCKRAP